MATKRRVAERAASLGVTGAAAVLVGIGGLFLAVYGLLPGVDLPVPLFQAGVLALLGSAILELQGERRTLAETIQRLQSGDRAAGPYESRESAYEAAARLIRTTSPEREADALLLVSSLHAHSEPLTDDPSATVEFREALTERLRERWRVHQVVTFTSEERMDAFVRGLTDLPTGSRLHVRAFVETNGLPAISTLVVARKAAMLALDDDRVHGVGSAVGLSAPELALWCESHFDSLWDAAPFTIWRPATGLDVGAIEQIRAVLHGSLQRSDPIVVEADGPGSYARATAAIWDEIGGEGEIRIDLANLHGLAGGARRARPDLTQPWIDRFEEALDHCLVHQAGRSHVRAIYNVNSLERLVALKEKLDRWSAADRLEVRALCVSDALATISPLIVGARQLFLGSEGDRLYRTARSMNVTGEGATAWGREYFDIVWGDSRAITVRTAEGTQLQGLSELEERIIRTSHGSLET